MRAARRGGVTEDGMREGTPLFGLCVYCGQRTEADTPEALVDVIEAHTLTCDQRPEDLRAAITPDRAGRD